jgi:Predicted transcriptional regulator
MKTLTKAEEQVMQALWELQQGFLKAIMKALPEPRPHPNTVATILRILVKKEFVTYEAQGRNNLYRPLVSKEEYGKQRIDDLVKSYFDGSPGKLVAQLVKDKKLCAEELEALVAVIRTGC